MLRDFQKMMLGIKTGLQVSIAENLKKKFMGSSERVVMLTAARVERQDYRRPTPPQRAQGGHGEINARRGPDTGQRRG